MTVDAHLFPVLEQTAQARTFTVKSLIFDELKRGRIRLPNFQRPLRWTAKDNVNLFDSLLRGYPIGSILLWKRPAEAGHLRIGAGDLVVPAAADARWVVDGQQRITALAAAMLELPNQAKDYLVHFDPHKNEFFVPMSPVEHRSDDVPLTILTDAAKLNKWIRTRQLPEALEYVIDAAHQRIIEYSLSVYEIESIDESPVRAAFMRINTTGMPLRAEEVFHALLGQTSEGRETLHLDALAEEVRACEFGVLERGEALKCILGMSGLNPMERPENIGSEQLRKLVPSEDARQAIRGAVLFLQEYARIPHICLLPYPGILILLTRFFHVHSHVEVANLMRLARWVWLDAIRGLHQRTEVSRIPEELDQIREADAPTTSIDRLLENLPKAPVVRWELRPFDLESAESRVEVLTLLDREPRRMPLLPGESDGGIATPYELLEGDRLATEICSGKSTRKRGKTAANRILIHGPRSGLSSTLEKLDPKRHASLLGSHVLDERMLAALRDGNADAFLQLRGETLIQLVSAFLRKRAGIGEPMMAPINAYLD